MKEKPRIHLLQVGQIFKNFAGLYRFLTGKEPPSGKRNQDAVKNQFKKYFEWKLLKDIDSQTTSKRAIIITKIYDSPITLPEDRGKLVLLMCGQFQNQNFYELKTIKLHRQSANNFLDTLRRTILHTITSRNNNLLTGLGIMSIALGL